LKQTWTGRAAVTPINAEYIMSWAKDAGSRRYIAEHKTRLVKTLELIPEGAAEKAILEMGAYMQITPSLKTRLGYGYVRGCYFGKLGVTEHKAAESQAGSASNATSTYSTPSATGSPTLTKRSIPWYAVS
jgi:hypothetical protein